jgi:hypothetical protein
MTSPRDDAIEAGALDLHERALRSLPSSRELARHILDAAIQSLLPGLFVAPDGDGEPTIWQCEGEPTPGIPAHLDGAPISLLTRSTAPELFDILAAVLPKEQ